MRGATIMDWFGDTFFIISIHAPHAGRDYPRKPVSHGDGAISIHAPHAGRDQERSCRTCRSRNFNPRAPCGARHEGAKKMLTENIFQSTRPMRGATLFPSSCRKRGNISIHAPHAGRDSKIVVSISTITNFNPRAPCGARLQGDVVLLNEFLFQSTRPMRGATILLGIIYLWEHISIHAPHAGRDSKSEQIALHIFAKKAWIPDIFAQNAAFQSVLPLADRQKLLYLRCEPLRKFLRAFASHYKIIGSSGR